MRCASCGFPLSPTASSCPRCKRPVQGQHSSGFGHAPIAEAQQQTLTAQQYNSNNVSEVGPGLQSQAWNTPWQAAPAAFSPSPSYLPTPSASVPVAQPTNITGEQLGEQFFQAPPTFTPDPFVRVQEAAPAPVFPQFPQAAQGQSPLQNGSNNKKAPIPFGFTVASLCVITGGLILVFVYFLSLGVLSTDNAALQSAAAHPKKAPTTVVSPSPTTIAATSTPTYPGQQYVDNVAMASAVVTTTAAPVTVSNTFKVKQKMYVTFEVHTVNHSTGGICLLWYLNNKEFTSFAFPVSSSTSAYSYAFANSVGTGNVEIYWSSAASCLDPNKQLAQKAQFTVTA